MARVELKSVRKNFGSLSIIPELNLDVRSGEFIALVGPSGCGKSTILRMVAGLEDPTSGTILIEGRPVNDVTPSQRGVAMVFQNYALYPHMTVRQNLAFPLKMAKVGASEMSRRIGEAAEILGLQELLDRRPSQLSGGQKQRVAMGRAMVSQPKVLLFDEPLSNLDAQLRVRVRSEIAHLHKRIGSTIIYVTHDQVEAMTLADRIAVLNRGVLEQLGSPLEVYHQPSTRFVASFIGTPPMNFLPADRLIGSYAANGAETVGFRPEMAHLRASRVGSFRGGADSDSWVELCSGRVSLLEPLGSTTHVHVRVDEGSIVAELRTPNPPALEEQVGVWVDPRELFLFDREGGVIRARQGTVAEVATGVVQPESGS